MSDKCPSIFRPWARKRWKEEVMVTEDGVKYTRDPMNPEAKPIRFCPCKKEDK